MAPRRLRKGSNTSDGCNDDQLSKEQRQKKGALFIQQFQKEAQDRMNEMEAQLEETLATVDRVFKVELMKMPPAVQNTLIIDLINADDNSPGEVTIAIKSESPDHQPLTRKPSKKVKISDGTPKQATATNRKIMTESVKGVKKNRSRVNSSSSGHIRSASVTNARRIQSHLDIDNVSDQTLRPGMKHRSIVRSASDGHLPCSLSALVPHVTVSTSLGETLCLSETIDDVDVRLLDDRAVFQMKKLWKMMDYLFKVKEDQS
ncbi:hypothetical protein UPYG_G00082030 [Umbra pygmaea]|uniref:Borealin N-terminal domain-containing protein n=1 Tax=Umbra pygmaea TaxID=75934 RepID=A0ABD0XGW1_UMBPY